MLGPDTAEAPAPWSDLLFDGVEHSDVSTQGEVALAYGDQVSVVAGDKLKRGEIDLLGTYKADGQIQGVKFDAAGNQLIVIDAENTVRVLSRTLSA